MSYTNCSTAHPYCSGRGLNTTIGCRPAPNAVWERHSCHSSQDCACRLNPRLWATRVSAGSSATKFGTTWSQFTIVFKTDSCSHAPNHPCRTCLLFLTSLFIFLCTPGESSLRFEFAQLHRRRLLEMRSRDPYSRPALRYFDGL